MTVGTIGIHHLCTESLTTVCTLCGRHKVVSVDMTDKTIAICKENYWHSGMMWNWVS